MVALHDHAGALVIGSAAAYPVQILGRLSELGHAERDLLRVGEFRQPRGALVRRQAIRVRVAVEGLQDAGLLLVQAVLVDEGAAEVEHVVHVTDPSRTRLLAGVAVGAGPHRRLEVGGGQVGGRTAEHRRRATGGGPAAGRAAKAAARRLEPGTRRGSARSPHRRPLRASAAAAMAAVLAVPATSSTSSSDSIASRRLNGVVSLVRGRAGSWAATEAGSTSTCESPVHARPTMRLKAAAACVHQSTRYAITSDPLSLATPLSRCDSDQPTKATAAQSLGRAAMRNASSAKARKAHEQQPAQDERRGGPPDEIARAA